jgi:hypothetical protein
VGVEGFDFERGAVGLGEQRYGACREGAIYVHQENFDAFGAFGYGGGDFGLGLWQRGSPWVGERMSARRAR